MSGDTSVAPGGHNLLALGDTAEPPKVAVVWGILPILD